MFSQPWRYGLAVDPEAQRNTGSLCSGRQWKLVVYDSWTFGPELRAFSGSHGLQVCSSASLYSPPPTIPPPQTAVHILYYSISPVTSAPITSPLNLKNRRSWPSSRWAAHPATPSAPLVENKSSVCSLSGYSDAVVTIVTFKYVRIKWKQFKRGAMHFI